jgi:hypothetical protein
MKNVLMRLVEEEYRKQLNAEDGKFDEFLKDLFNNLHGNNYRLEVKYGYYIRSGYCGMGK